MNDNYTKLFMDVSKLKLDDADYKLWLELFKMGSAKVMQEFEKAIKFSHYDYNMEQPRYPLSMLRAFIFGGLEDGH